MNVQYWLHLDSQSSWKVCEINYWLPCGADGQSVVRSVGVGHMITKFFGMDRFTYPWCSAGMFFCVCKSSVII